MPRRRPAQARPKRSPEPIAPRRSVGIGNRRGMRILVGALAVLTIGLGRFLGMNPPDSAPSETSGRSSKQSEKSNRSGDSLTWLQRIDRLRVEERTVEALSVGWSAYHTVPPSRRPELLRALTLALLTDVPEDQAATALQKRIEADPDDLDARVAVLRRSLTAESAPPQSSSDRPLSLTQHQGPGRVIGDRRTGP